MRVFYAINLPNAVRYEFEAIIEQASQANQIDYLKWTKPRSLHLTLHFLDEQDDERVSRLIEIGKNVAKNLIPTNASMGDWGGFPNLNQPKILFISLKDADQIIEMHQALSQELKNHHFEVDPRPFDAHITVARIKNNSIPLNLHLPETGEMSWPVESFELMKSNLLPDGAEYDIIESFKL